MASKPSSNFVKWYAYGMLFANELEVNDTKTLNNCYMGYKLTVNFELIVRPKN